MRLAGSCLLGLALDWVAGRLKRGAGLGMTEIGAGVDSERVEGVVGVGAGGVQLGPGESVWA